MEPDTTQLNSLLKRTLLLTPRPRPHASTLQFTSGFSLLWLYRHSTRCVFAFVRHTLPSRPPLTHSAV